MKKPITVTVETEVTERARDICYWMPQFNMSMLVEMALIDWMDDWEKHGQIAIKGREGKLRRGRPLSIHHEQERKIDSTY